MPLSLNASQVAGAAVQAAKDAADAAMAAAQNARQMVLNRDPTLTAATTDIGTLKTNQTDLATLANNYQAALALSLADRQSMHTQIDELIAQLAAMTAVANSMPTLRTGISLVTASLLAGATRDVVVTLSAPMPTATYAAGAWILGGTSLLGQTQLVGITGQTKDNVTVQVKNTGLTSIAASALTVQVLAVK